MVVRKESMELKMFSFFEGKEVKEELTYIQLM